MLEADGGVTLVVVLTTRARSVAGDATGTHSFIWWEVLISHFFFNNDDAIFVGSGK